MCTESSGISTIRADRFPDSAGATTGQKYHTGRIWQAAPAESHVSDKSKSF